MNSSILYVGIDVSKGYADFQPLDQDQSSYEDSFRLNDTTQGYARLEQIVQTWLDQGMDQIYFGVESTGGYENNWVNFLLRCSRHKPVHITRLNPVGIKSLRKAGQVRTVTDSVSAEYIALYMMVMPKKVRWLRPEQSSNNEFAGARKFQRSILMLDKHRQQLGNQLEKLLYNYFSPWLVYTRNGIPAWMLQILSRYSSPQSVRRAGVERLVKIKFVSEEKASRLVKKLAGHQMDPGVLDKENLKQTARQILHLNELIAKRHRLLNEQYREDWQVKLLMSLPGIGLQTAVLLRIEIEDVDRFASAKKMATYFGVSPKYVESGDKKGQVRMSKQGRPEVRKALYMSGLSAIRHDERIKNLYYRYRKKGHNHYQAMGVIMHKLLRIVYGVLTSETAYDPAIDQANQNRAKEKQKLKEATQQTTQSHWKKRLHRYQGESISAPRSRRAVQKIKKKQMASQSSAVEECAGSPNASYESKI